MKKTLSPTGSDDSHEYLFNSSSFRIEFVLIEEDMAQLNDYCLHFHVMPFAKGGKNLIENYLPACYTCNRLKWHRSPEDIQLIMQLGIYARNQIDHDTPLGRKLAQNWQD